MSNITRADCSLFSAGNHLQAQGQPQDQVPSLTLTIAGKKYHFQNQTVMYIWHDIFSLTKRSSSSMSGGEYYSITLRPYMQFGGNLPLSDLQQVRNCKKKIVTFLFTGEHGWLRCGLRAKLWGESWGPGILQWCFSVLLLHRHYCAEVITTNIWS